MNLQIGLCGFRAAEVPVGSDQNLERGSTDFTRTDMVALNAILESQNSPEYSSVDFKACMRLTRYGNLYEKAKGSGENHVFLMYRAEFQGNMTSTNCAQLYVYAVVLALNGCLQTRLFAKSFPTTHSCPGVWMNRLEEWKFIDYSLGAS